MSRRNYLQAGAIAIMAAGLTATLTAPAKAQVACDPRGYLGSELFGGVSCFIGDKIYSNFVVTAGANTAGKLNSAIFSFGNPDPSHVLNVSQASGFLVGSYGYTYKVTVKDGPFTFASIKTTATGALQPGPNLYTKTLSSNPPTVPVTVIANQTSPGGDSVTGFYPVNSNVTSATFTSLLTVTRGGLTLTSDTLVQKTTEVPGPLAILGAGTAFAFSRKLRRRISVAS